jgi:DNA-directed RNA polymerase subunit RPC12/RpoP
VEIEEHHDILEKFDEYGNPCDVEYDVVIKNNRLQIKSPICKYGGEIGYRYKTILDGLKDLQEIKDTCICSNCGKEFVFNNKTKRIVCDECWKKKEKERIKIAVAKNREKLKCNGQSRNS